MEIIENKDFLLATKLTRLATFLETEDEKKRYRNAVYNAIIWGKRH